MKVHAIYKFHLLMGVLKLSLLSAVVNRRSNRTVACKLGLDCRQSACGPQIQIIV